MFPQGLILFVLQKVEKAIEILEKTPIVFNGFKHNQIMS